MNFLFVIIFNFIFPFLLFPLKKQKEDKPCQTSTLTQLELGLGFIAANLCIIAVMMGIQIYRGNNGSNSPNERNSNGSISFLRIITCCCNPVMITQCCANIFGMNTFYSFLGKPNKRDTYTV